jgi:hypothetical protein
MKRVTSSKNTTAPDATFVFKGTIKKTKASNVKQAAISDRTCIVTVDEVIDASPNLAPYRKQDITVELSRKRSLKAGAKLIFHATPWLYAENLAVRSLQEEPETSDVTTGHRVNAAAQRDARAAVEHLKDADLVISGKVVAVRLPQVDSTKTKKDAALTQTTTSVSEHDPKWREAIIEVEKVHKGKLSKRQIVVRFPASTDVAWRRSPKFEAGQQGYFALHKATDPRAKSAAKSAGTRSPQSYTIRDAQDFQPFTEAGGIKSLVESESPSRPD